MGSLIAVQVMGLVLLDVAQLISKIVQLHLERLSHVVKLALRWMWCMFSILKMRTFQGRVGQCENVGIEAATTNQKHECVPEGCQ